MVRRQIFLEQIASLMDHPDQIVEAHGGLVCYQCLITTNAEDFEDLQIWQRSRVLTNVIYDAFEKIRDYDFRSQI